MTTLQQIENKQLSALERVEQLMKEQGMDTTNRALVTDAAMIYVQAQMDQIQETLEGIK